MMWRYELKKVFVKRSNQIALLILTAFLGINCFFAIEGVHYVDGQGEVEYGYAAVRKLRAEKKLWAGVLDEERLAAVIEENAALAATEEYHSNDARQSNIAFSRMQGFSDIREMLNHAFCAFREYDYYRTDSLKPEDAEAFYPNRLLQVRKWLDTEAEGWYSETEKEYILHSYETLETPFYYDYSDGWQQLFAYSSAFTMMVMLILGFLVTGIFSSEFTLKADAVFFASCHGRGKAVRAKMLAGIALVTGVYWLAAALFSAVVLAFLGADGAGLAIQTGFGGWKSLYHITNLQKYILIFVAGYVGCLFLSLDYGSIRQNEKCRAGGHGSVLFCVPALFSRKCQIACSGEDNRAAAGPTALYGTDAEPF